MKEFLSTYATNPKNLHTLKDVMDYTARTSCEEYARWGMSEWIKVEEAAARYNTSSEAYKRSCDRRLSTARQIPELLDRYNCDLLVVSGATDTSADIAGCPAISVPMASFPMDYPIEQVRSGMVSKGPNIPYGQCIFFKLRYDLIRI